MVRPTPRTAEEDSEAPPDAPQRGRRRGRARPPEGEAESPSPPRRRGRFARLRRYLARAAAFIVLVVASCSMINPPTTWTIMTQGQGGGRGWTRMDRIAPVMARSVVAAEDANFCAHWGFDMAEIRRAIAEGSNRGASTISQQVTKNVFLWQNRSWPRKAMEAALTPVVEATWSKRRILEVYLNVAEFGPGIFGIKQGAMRHFGTTPEQLTPMQAARLAAILPSPRTRDPAGPEVAARARAIADGAATIERDGRDDCFQPTVATTPGG